MFQQAQTLIKKNRPSGGREYGHPHCALLKKLIRCGNCGAVMAHTYAKKKNKLYRYYQCTTKQKQGMNVCDTRPLPAQEIEDFVVDMIRHIGKDPELANQVFAETVERRANQRILLEREQQRLRDERQQIENKINQLLAAIELSDSDLHSLGEKLRGKEELLLRTNQCLTEVENSLEELCTQTADTDNLTDALTHFDSLWDVLTQRETIKLIHQLLEGVLFQPESSTVTLDFNIFWSSQ